MNRPEPVPEALLDRFPSSQRQLGGGRRRCPKHTGPSPSEEGTWDQTRPRSASLLQVPATAADGREGGVPVLGCPWAGSESRGFGAREEGPDPTPPARLSCASQEVVVRPHPGGTAIPRRRPPAPTGCTEGSRASCLVAARGRLSCPLHRAALSGWTRDPCIRSPLGPREQGL